MTFFESYKQIYTISINRQTHMKKIKKVLGNSNLYASMAGLINRSGNEPFFKIRFSLPSDFDVIEYDTAGYPQYLLLLKTKTTNFTGLIRHANENRI